MSKKHWDERFLALAAHISAWSKDPSTKVGAVIADSSNRVVSLGFNGFPRGIADSDSRLQDRKEKYPRVVHAERNALLFAHRDLSGCTLYTHPFQPCAACAGMIIQAGITRVVTRREYPDRWLEDFKLAQEIFREANVWLDLQTAA